MSAGHLLDLGGWQHLNLPAIAEIEEKIEIAPGRYHTRKVGDLLIRRGSRRRPSSPLKAPWSRQLFSAQYQQSPVPPTAT
jgi:hypothetical protein